MGAPTGHPFFGNQYTDGGDKLSSFTYEAIDKGVGAFRSAAELSKDTAEKVMHSVTRLRKMDHPGLKPVKKGVAKDFISPQLIAAGIVVTAVTVGGILAYRHIKKNRIEKETLQFVEVDHADACVDCDEPRDAPDFDSEMEADTCDGTCRACEN